MKLINHMKLESSIISTTLFLTGMILSAGALYEYQNNPAGITIPQIGMTIGLTFFLGLISIHFAARSIKQTVVYLERKKEERKATEATTETQSQLNMHRIQEIVNKGQDMSRLLLNEISQQLEVGQAALYVAKDTTLELKFGYALSPDRTEHYSCNLGEGLIGRVARAGSSLYVDNIPEGYIRIYSSLGSASPTYLAIIPALHENEVKAVLELALFKPLAPATLQHLEEISQVLAATEK